jgi:ferritin-like protein
VSDSPIVTALLAAAAAENAAVYGYSVAGARLATGHDKNAARVAYDAHRAQVQNVTQWLADLGAVPAPASPVYRLPSAVVDNPSARALLAAIEESTAATYADIVAVASGQLQHDAALELQAAAIREAQWRTTPVPFPGLVGRLSG